MNKPMDEMLEGQKKFWEYWSDLSNKVSETWATGGKTFGLNGNGKQKDFFDMQKAYFDEMMKNSQNQNWADWAEKGNKWVKENLLNLIPANMQPHYQNFNSAYGDLYKHWENFQRLMEFGMMNRETIDKYFSADAYQRFMNQLMGFKISDNTGEMLDKANAFFNEYIHLLENMSVNSGAPMSSWKKAMDQLSKGEWHPMFQTMSDLNLQLGEQLTPYFNMMSEGKEKKMVTLLKDIQFAFSAYTLKSNEMQAMIYKAGQDVLPATLQKLYDQFQSSKEMPDYQNFFNNYINDLEGSVLVVLHGDTYGQLQSDVSKAAVTIKSRYDELVELTFNGLPFVMKSEVDDMARENMSLRNKIRTLEQRLTDLEQKVAGPNSNPPVVAETTAAPKKSKTAKV